jgi:sialic acid synthase SpsE
MPIIAEIGSNFEGSKTRAKEMIHAVAENGGDIAKFQLFKPEQYPHNIALPEEWIPELDEECSKNGIGFLLSAFYHCENFWFPVIKIAFSQRHNFRLIGCFNRYTKSKLIISGDKYTYFPEDSIKLLCVPKYPATKIEYHNASLGFDYDGISDHTEGISLISNILDIKPLWVEKHFKLGDEKKSLDAGSFAMTPNELKELSRVLKGV